MKRKAVLIIVFAIITSLVMGACTTKQQITPENTVEKEPEKTSQVLQDTTEANKTKEPSKFSIFYQEAGQNFPEGFKHNDNWFIKYICETANVELTEVIVPAYSDTGTKFNLMMSSGDIPDLVERANVDDMKKYGMEGAFMPTEDIIRNSPVISKFYDNVQIMNMRSADEVAYVIVNPPKNDDYNIMWARWDLLQKLGYKEFPKTVDEWVNACRKLKQFDPDSIPLASIGLQYAWFVFKPFNAGWDGCGWEYFPERGKVCNIWEGENIVRAVEFGKMLYDEGLWDKEFITTQSADYKQKKLQKNVLLHYNNIGSLTGYLQLYLNGDQPDVRLIPAMIPTADGAGVDQYYYTPSLLGGYAFGINANTKEKEGIIRFLEVLYSSAVKEMAVYGRENYEYKVVNNEKVPIFPAAADNSWRTLYGWMFVNCAERLNYQPRTVIESSTSLNDVQKKEYTDLIYKADLEIRSKIYGHLSYNPMSLAQPIGDDLANLANQTKELQKSLIIKAISGEISIDQFIIEKENLVKKYQNITDALNKSTDEAKVKFGLK